MTASRRARAAAALAWLALAGVAPGAAGAAGRPVLTPPHERITDRAIARDRAALEALGARIAAFDTVASPARRYTRALAAGWQRLARGQYELNDRSGLAEESFDRAADLLAILESGGSSLRSQERDLAGSPRMGDELWWLADSLKRTPAVQCVAAEIAGLELALVRAGHERTVCRPDDPRPAAAALAGIAADLRRRAARCGQPEETPVRGLPPEVGARVVAALERLGTLSNVHFNVNSATLSPESRAVLDSVALVMISVPEIRATLVGHTDPRGSAAYNLALSRRRSRAVLDHLVRAGVPAPRLRIQAEGKSSPITLGSGRREHALNRRVEIVFSTPDGVELEIRRQERDLQIESERNR